LYFLNEEIKKISDYSVLVGQPFIWDKYLFTPVKKDKQTKNINLYIAFACVFLKVSIADLWD